MTQFNEAPTSFNVKAISPGGFDVMLTIRAAEGADLMPKALAALDWLTAQGFTSTRNGHAAPSSSSSSPSTNGNGTQAAANGTAPICPAHGEQMKPSKYGGWYCPVKVADDGGDGKPVYCKQRVKA